MWMRFKMQLLLLMVTLFSAHGPKILLSSAIPSGKSMFPKVAAGPIEPPPSAPPPPIVGDTAPPLELTHLFTNKDGTLDDTLLFSAHNGELPDIFRNLMESNSATPLVFLSKNNTVVKAHSGSTVVLPCIIQKESKFEMIMWARQLQGANTSYQILTIGDSTHINDNRFLIATSEVNNDWSLRLLRVQTFDSGAYKCQANSHPPQFITIHLSVQEAYAEIEGPREKFIKAGSALVLNCTFNRLTEKPAYVFWYHNARMVSHDRSRGQTVEIQPTYSTLRLPQVTGLLDSGNYTCAPHNLSPDAVTVHILGGQDSGGGEDETAAAAIHTSDDSEVLDTIVGSGSSAPMTTLTLYCALGGLLISQL